MSRLLNTAIAGAIVLLVGGCTTMHTINKQSLDDYAKTQQQLNQHISTFNTDGHDQQAPIISDLPYVDTTAVVHHTDLPSIFFETASLNSPSQPLWQLVDKLQSMTGIDVHADDDLSGQSASAGGAGPVAVSMDATLAPPSILSAGTRSGARANVGPISYQGTVKGLLDSLTSTMDATWSYDASSHSIRIYRYETRSFHIDTVPGDSNTDASVDSGNGSSVQGSQGQTLTIGQSKTNTKFTGKLSVWTALQTNIKPLLSANGSLNVSEPTATITVRDRWDRVDAIEKYIEQTNKSLGTQVEVNVTVYRVHSSDADNRGINWSILYNTLGQSASAFGATITTPRPSPAGLSSLILNAPTQRPNGSAAPFAGSQFFLDALSTLGKTSVVTNASVETVNNTAAPLKVVQTTAYVAQTTSLLTTGVGSGQNGVVGAGATLTPGAVETGFTMQVLPSVQPDGHRMLLQVMLSLSTLDALPTFSSGGETIQLPTVSAREFLQRVWMKSGQALVLAGFQNTEADNTTQTPTTESLWLLGGNRTVNRAKDAVVIVITPVATAPQTTLADDQNP